MHYQNNSASSGRDIVRKLNTDAQPDMLLTLSHAHEWRGKKMQLVLHIDVEISILFESSAISELHT